MTFRQDNNRRVDSDSSAEDTLRLLAQLPAPEGLADRVKTHLSSAPRTVRILQWPSWIAAEGAFYGNALRGVAAAAIVCIVAGGGWQVYSHVQVAPMTQSAPAIVPARIGNGGFSSAGAMRTPNSPNGPVLTHALIPNAVHTPAPNSVPAPPTATPAAKAPLNPHAATPHAKQHKHTPPPSAPQR